MQLPGPLLLVWEQGEIRRIRNVMGMREFGGQYHLHWARPGIAFLAAVSKA